MVAAAVAVSGVASAAMSSRSADKNSRRAASGEQAELAFAMERYDDWKEVFGPIQENLANYYENLDPEFVAAQGIELYEQEKQRALTSARETLAQRGLSTSGLAAAVETDVAVQSATERARIRAEAPMKVAQMQTNFLQVGLGQNPGNSVQNVLSNNASRANQRAIESNRIAGQAVGGAIDGLVDYYAFTQREEA